MSTDLHERLHDVLSTAEIPSYRTTLADEALLVGTPTPRPRPPLPPQLQGVSVQRVFPPRPVDGVQPPAR